MKKRMLPLLLALCMVFALLPGSVFAADVVASGSCGDDATWTLDSDGVLTVSGTGIMSEPTGLPSSPTVRSAIISEGITGIGNSAFASYSSMVSVSLPDSLTSIGENAFDRCVKLSGIEIPDGVTEIRNYAFSSCYDLQYAVLPSRITQIPTGMFRQCYALQSLVVPEGVIAICANAFDSCSNMKVLCLPSSLEFIAINVFILCDRLEEIWYAGTEEQLSNIVIQQGGNYKLADVDVYLIPSLPDPIYGFFDMPARSSWAYPGIAYCLDHGLMNGVSDTEFDPDGTLTRAMLVTVLWRLAGEPEATQDCAFPDLGSADDPAASWYLDAVAWAAEAGIVNGRPDGTFDPKGAITRQELATMLYRFAGVMKLDTSAKGDLSVFPDEDQVLAYAVDAMTWANGAGLVKGNSRDGVNYLDPWGNATRAQVATILMRFCENVAQ